MREGIVTVERKRGGRSTVHAHVHDRWRWLSPEALGASPVVIREAMARLSEREVIDDHDLYAVHAAAVWPVWGRGRTVAEAHDDLDAVLRALLNAIETARPRTALWAAIQRGRELTGSVYPQTVNPKINQILATAEPGILTNSSATQSGES